MEYIPVSTNKQESIPNHNYNPSSELDQCQTELHQALSTLVLWTNRHVMLNITSDTPPDALVTPVTQLVQVCA